MLMGNAYLYRLLVVSYLSYLFMYLFIYLIDDIIDATQDLCINLHPSLVVNSQWLEMPYFVTFSWFGKVIVIL